jgi:integrase
LLDAKWQDFDLEKRIWTVEFNKTGRTRYIPISDGMMRLLQEVPKYEGCDWVFPNPKTLKPYVSIFCSWNTARKKAGLPDVRIHDLRHSFASFLINSGRSLYEVQKILGHTQVKTTQRYAHLSQDSLVAAANTVSVQIPLLSEAMPRRVKDVHLLEAR